MPFCAQCDHFYNPNTLSDQGDCPDGHHVADPDVDELAPTLPWHFKVMLVFLVVYLGWRLIQLLAWVAGTVF